MSVICVDFDDVLMDTKNINPGYRLGLPIDGAVPAMHKLAAEGNTLIVFTVRGGEARSKKAVEDWLNYFNIPFSTVTNIKVRADVYIDDRGIHFDSWPQTLVDLERINRAK